MAKSLSTMFHLLNSTISYINLEQTYENNCDFCVLRLSSDLQQLEFLQDSQRQCFVLQAVNAEYAFHMAESFHTGLLIHVEKGVT